jgi:isopentenyl diphosphate isomerase/L-lactate dehydrogenase-like FMN-dependent dehydrogenase
MYSAVRDSRRAAGVCARVPCANSHANRSHHIITRCATHTSIHAQVGRRERDMRNHIAAIPGAPHRAAGDDKRGVAAALRTPGLIDDSITWGADVRWLRGLSRKRLVLKGVQCGDDAVRAAAEGADGIIVSNHVTAGGSSTTRAPRWRRCRR